MMKKCELCKVRARTFCESDQASLCWTCDAKVHGANFLVARHSRTLLCRSCDSLTPWKATGAALVNAISVCDGCANREREEEEESEGDNDDETDTEDDDDGDIEDEDGDNQVVPWSASTPPPPPPPASSSGSEESVNGDGDGSDPATTTTSLKRRRDDDASDRHFQEGSSGSVSQRRGGGEWRDEVAERAGEPPLKRWLGPLKSNGSRSCCRNGGASDGV